MTTSKYINGAQAKDGLSIGGVAVAFGLSSQSVERWIAGTSKGARGAHRSFGLPIRRREPGVPVPKTPAQFSVDRHLIVWWRSVYS
jgi:hypothetical protein